MSPEAPFLMGYDESLSEQGRSNEDAHGGSAPLRQARRQNMN